MQLQRARVERALRDQLEQRRVATKALQASEPLPDFDLVDVLQKALVLVQSTAAPPSTDADVAANLSDAADSFDENTFYSSNFSTPLSHQVSRLPNENETEAEAMAGSEDSRIHEVSDSEPELVHIAVAQASQVSGPIIPTGPRASPPRQHPPEAAAHLPKNPNLPPRPPSPLGKYNPSHFSHAAGILLGISSQESGEASGSGDSGNTDNEQVTGRRHHPASNQPHGRDGPLRVDSPLVRSHDLSPVAPQPSPHLFFGYVETAARPGTRLASSPRSPSPSCRAQEEPIYRV